jgi:hypothetical protein
VTTVFAEFTADKAVLRREEFERLLELARRSEPVEVRTEPESREEEDMTRLAVRGGAFDFWKAPGEDIYSPNDGEAV